VAYHELRIDRIVQETPDARSFVLSVPEELAERYRYQAGQFLTFRVPWQGGSLIRCYSLASAPGIDALPKVTVKRVEQGRVSNWFNDQLERGDRIEVMPPAGRFVPRGEDEPLLLFAGGSGITPVISIVKTVLASSTRQLRLFYANRDAASVIFRSELDELMARHGDRLEVIHHLDDESGFASATQLEAAVSGFEAAQCYVCGPGPFMDVAEQAMTALEIPSDQVFIERFLYEEAAHATAEPAGAPADAVASVRIYLDGNVTDVACREGETILEAADRSGLDAPCACRDGYCGACMAKVTEGEVKMKLNDGGLDDAQVKEGWVLTCQGLPQTPVVHVDYPDPD